MKKIITLAMMAIAFSAFPQSPNGQPFPYYLMDGGRYDNKPGPSDGIIQLLDSVYHYTFSEETGWLVTYKDADFVYENNLLVNQTTYTYSNGSWIPDNLLYIKRNFAGDPDSTFSKRMSNGIWVNNYLEVEKYNSLHLRTFYSGNFWDGHWIENYQEISTYDSVGNKLSRTVKEFDMGSYTTVNSFQHTFTYNLNNQLHTSQSSRWSNNDWVPQFRVAYYYNSNGKYDSVIVEHPQGNGWNYSYRFIMTYMPDSSLVTTLWQGFENGQWLNSAISKAYFTDEGRYSHGLGQIWIDNDWQTTSRDKWGYDNFGNVNFEMAEQPVGNDWLPTGISRYTYDQQRFLLNASHTSYDLGVLMGSDSTVYYFQKVLGLEEVAEDNLTIYPNPATDYFAISSEFAAKQVEIYDSHGRPVKFINSPGKQVDVKGLASGMYLVRIIGVEESRMVKMVHK